MSLHAAGILEPQTNYVWENLRSARFCDGVAEGFSRDRITSSFREYAIAGALHLDHLATLNESALNARRLKASASSLSANLGIRSLYIAYPKEIIGSLVYCLLGR